MPTASGAFPPDEPRPAKDHYVPAALAWRRFTSLGSFAARPRLG